MKMLTAIIRPERQDDVVSALEAAGIGRTLPVKRTFPQGPVLPRLPPRSEIETFKLLTIRHKNDVPACRAEPRLMFGID
jgi:hypothetical protein